MHTKQRHINKDKQFFFLSSFRVQGKGRLSSLLLLSLHFLFAVVGLSVHISNEKCLWLRSGQFSSSFCEEQGLLIKVVFISYPIHSIVLI